LPGPTGPVTDRRDGDRLRLFHARWSAGIRLKAPSDHRLTVDGEPFNAR
jgi:hypothetical protein